MKTVKITMSVLVDPSVGGGIEDCVEAIRECVTAELVYPFETMKTFEYEVYDADA